MCVHECIVTLPHFIANLKLHHARVVLLLLLLLLVPGTASPQGAARGQECRCFCWFIRLP